MKVVVLPNALTRYARSLELLYPNISEVERGKMTDRLFDHIGLLARFPGLGQVEPQLARLNMGHRRLVVGHFKVVYRADGDTIVVVDIFDSLQDPDEMSG